LVDKFGLKWYEEAAGATVGICRYKHELFAKRHCLSRADSYDEARARARTHTTIIYCSRTTTTLKDALDLLEILT